MVIKKYFFNFFLFVSIACVFSSSVLPMTDKDTSSQHKEKKSRVGCAERCISKLSNTKLWTGLCNALGTWAIKNTTDQNSDDPKEMSFFIRDASWECNGVVFTRDALSSFQQELTTHESKKEEHGLKRKIVFGAKIVGLGLCVGAVFIVPVLQAAKNYQNGLSQRGDKCSGKACGTVGKGHLRNIFNTLDRGNDVCRQPLAPYPGCCNSVNSSTVVCCRTDGVEDYCFLNSVDVLPRTKMFEFDHDGAIKHTEKKHYFNAGGIGFNNGNYIQQGNIVVFVMNSEKLDKKLVEKIDEKIISEPDISCDLVEIPDELLAYVIATEDSFEKDKEDLLAACKRKEISKQVQEQLLAVLKKNHDLLLIERNQI